MVSEIKPILNSLQTSLLLAVLSIPFYAAGKAYQCNMLKMETEMEILVSIANLLQVAVF